jgi:superfamily I DNA/RNA helicase
MNQIKYWLNNGNKCGDIAVLSRNNFHQALLANMLLREGIYCDMTDDMKLTKSFMYNYVKMVMSLAEDSWKPDTTGSILWKLCRFIGVANSRAIGKFQDSCGLSFYDTISYIVKHYIDKTVDFNKSLNISIQASKHLDYYISKFSFDTRNDILTLYRTICMNNIEEKVRALLFQYIQATSFLYKSDDRKRSIQGLVKYVINLIKKDGYENMNNFLRVTEQLEGGKMVIPGEKITLTTIHSAKGREWKNVIMFACDNVSQPSFDGIRKLVNDGIPLGDIYSNIDEERRLFYVGNTRAKENLFVITYDKPSVFILEALGAFDDKIGTGNNATIIELVNNDNWAENYKDVIQSKIMDTNSKHYYNPEDYKVTE